MFSISIAITDNQKLIHFNFSDFHSLILVFYVIHQQIKLKKTFKFKCIIKK